MPDLFVHAAAEEAEGRRRQMLRTAFGPAIAAALADPAVIEVMANPDGKLWIESVPAGPAPPPRRSQSRRVAAGRGGCLDRGLPSPGSAPAPTEG